MDVISCSSAHSLDLHLLYRGVAPSTDLSLVTEAPAVFTSQI